MSRGELVKYYIKLCATAFDFDVYYYDVDIALRDVPSRQLKKLEEFLKEEFDGCL